MEPGIEKALIGHHPHILQNTLVGVSVACGAMQPLNTAVQGCIGLAFVGAYHGMGLHLLLIS